MQTPFHRREVFFLPLLITSQLLNLSVVETDCKVPEEDETKVTVFSFTNKQMKKKREVKDLQILSEAKRWTTTHPVIGFSLSEGEAWKYRMPAAS